MYERGSKQATVEMWIPSTRMQAVNPLLREGVDVRVTLGRCVLDILHQDLGLSVSFIQDEIQSLFLDGHPVDDLQTVIQAEGSVLTLSAAMPGLVGACMRRGGAYAGFRDSISWNEQQQTQARQASGVIRIKVFNLLVDTLRPVLLAHGVGMETERLVNILDHLPDRVWTEGLTITVDGQTLDSRQEAAQQALSGKDYLWLRMHAADRE